VQEGVRGPQRGQMCWRPCKILCSAEFDLALHQKLWYVYYVSEMKAEAGTITFILISDQIVDHCSKINLRSYQDHMAVK
jgi:hypothetical protein